MKLQGWSVAGKSWVAFLGSLLTIAVPIVVQISTSLPVSWQLGIGGVIALLTAVGVYHAPYQPVTVPSPQPAPEPPAPEPPANPTSPGPQS